MAAGKAVRRQLAEFVLPASSNALRVVIPDHRATQEKYYLLPLPQKAVCRVKHREEVFEAAIWDKIKDLHLMPEEMLCLAWTRFLPRETKTRKLTRSSRS